MHMSIHINKQREKERESNSECERERERQTETDKYISTQSQIGAETFRDRLLKMENNRK